VSLWGSMEAVVEDMLLGMLVNERHLLKKSEFADTKLSLAEFETLEKEDRMRFLLDDLKGSRAMRGKRGADRYEALLEVFDLSCAVKPEIKQAMFEMQNVRNVIVHRGSFADRRFVKSCPALNFKIGEKIVVSEPMFTRYVNSLLEYAISLMHRLKAKYEHEPDNIVPDIE